MSSRIDGTIAMRSLIAALLLAPLAALHGADAPNPASKPNILMLLAEGVIGYRADNLLHRFARDFRRRVWRETACRCRAGQLQFSAGAGRPSTKAQTDSRTGRDAGGQFVAIMIRDGDWKLINQLGSGGFAKPSAFKPVPGDPPPAQLYNLRNDPAEMDRIVKSGRSR